MPSETCSREVSFGYLSAVYAEGHGYFGGYLIVSDLGRPLEFHCTSPVHPSRAHEILYGPTLQAYLLGEQIGGTLLAAAKIQPRIVLTDQAAMLAVRSRTAVPLAHLIQRASEGPSLAIHPSPCDNETASTQILDKSLSSCAESFEASNSAFRFAPGFESDQVAIAEGVAILSQRVELAEPFGRIHEAIREAQRLVGRTTNESHGQAA